MFNMYTILFGIPMGIMDFMRKQKHLFVEDRFKIKIDVEIALYCEQISGGGTHSEC